MKIVKIKKNKNNKKEELKINSKSWSLAMRDGYSSLTPVKVGLAF